MQADFFISIDAAGIGLSRRAAALAFIAPAVVTHLIKIYF